MKLLIYPTFLFPFLLLCKSYSQPDKSTLVYKLDGKEIAYPRLSKDNNKILYQTNQNGHWEIYMMDRASGKHTPVIADTYNSNFPDWSFDNEWIAFVSDRDGNEEVYVAHADGSGQKRITNDPARDIHPYFSPDGQYILFNSTRINGSLDIFRYTLATGALTILSQTHVDETCARYSMDMKQIVYLQNGATTDDVILADSLNQDQMNLSNTPEIRDGWPAFSYDGIWVYYSSMENGDFCLYRIKKDGTGKTQLTKANPEEEDARVSLSRDGQTLIYNKRVGNTIEIRELHL